MRYDNAHIKEIAGYHLAERIGSGGMGDVYKAFNPALNRTAAVKILHQKEMAERFRNEAYIQSSVSHANIACLYEYLVSGETPCIIMEFVDGESLDTYLHKRGKLSNKETENIIGQVASALAYLHKREILHRDIKPQNFKIQPDGKVTMLDFGIAKNKYTPKLTQLGFVVGTTEYMAPEQFQQKVEKKSDIWSLGVMTYELLTGYLPFEATNPVTLRSKIEKGGFTDPKIMVPQLSEKLKNVIDKSLRLNPGSRISAAEIENMLIEKAQPESAGRIPKQNSLQQIKQIQMPRIQMPQIKMPAFERRTRNIALIVIGLIIAIIFIAKNTSDDDVVIKENEDPVTTTVTGVDDNGHLQKMVINVASPSNAVIVLHDGTHHALPYEFRGKEGEKFDFTLQADGYVSKKFSGVEITTKGSYDYTLDKIKK